jgi:hypothetical protein
MICSRSCEGSRVLGLLKSREELVEEEYAALREAIDQLARMMALTDGPEDEEEEEEDEESEEE